MSQIAPSQYYSEETVEGIRYANYVQGGALMSRFGTLDHTDTTAKTLFTLPKGAIITRIMVDVTEAFNDGASNDLDIGLGGTANALADDLDVTNIGQIVTGMASYSLTPLTTATDVTVTFVPGTAATTGEATVFIDFMVVDS